VGTNLGTHQVHAGAKSRRPLDDPQAFYKSVGDTSFTRVAEPTFLLIL